MVAHAQTRSHRGAELLGLVAFALALMLLIALATFDPRDPAPFFRAGAEGSARNFIGPFGAFIAELLIPQLFGLSALLMPIALGLLGWKLFWCRPIEAPYTKAVGNAFALLALAALLSLTFGTVTFEGEPVRAGGATGELLAGLLLADFGRAGAYIVAATALFVSLILSTQFSFSAFLQGAGGRLGTRLRAMQTAFTHFRESRRKDRRSPLAQVINTSVNETLSRTILTNGTAFIAVLSLYLLGGSVIHGFAFALVIGSIIGTYSSVFVASSIVLFFERGPTAVAETRREGRASAPAARRT